VFLTKFFASVHRKHTNCLILAGVVRMGGNSLWKLWSSLWKRVTKSNSFVPLPISSYPSQWLANSSTPAAEESLFWRWWRNSNSIDASHFLRRNHTPAVCPKRKKDRSLASVSNLLSTSLELSTQLMGALTRDFCWKVQWVNTRQDISFLGLY